MQLTRIAATSAVSALVLVGCSSTSDVDVDTSPEAGEAAPSAEESDPLRVAYASDRDPNDVADQFGIEQSGAEWVALGDDSAVTAGLQNDEFEIGNVDVTAAIKAIQAGVPIKILYVAQNEPEFVMVAQPEITSLDQLAGETVAFHASGSLTEIFERELIRQNSPEVEDEIDWVVLPESPNRAAAMVAGRIDATSLEYLDILELQRQGEFSVLGSWADLTGPSGDALATVWITTDEFLASDRDRVVDFLTAIQGGYDLLYEDKQAWMDAAAELLPEVGEEDLSSAYDYYTESGMYPRSGTAPITEEQWEGLDEFFTQIGEYEEPASIDFVDLSVVDEVAGVS